MQSTNTSNLDPSKVVAISTDDDDDIQFVRCVRINHGTLQASPQRNDTPSQGGLQAPPQRNDIHSRWRLQAPPQWNDIHSRWRLQAPPQWYDTHSRGRAARPRLIGHGTSCVRPNCVRPSSVDPSPSFSDCALKYTRSKSTPQRGRITMAPPLSVMKAMDQVTKSKVIINEATVQGLHRSVETQSPQLQQSRKQQDQPASSLSKRKSIDSSTAPAAKRQTTVYLSTSNARQVQPSNQSRAKKLWSIPPFDPAKLANKSTLPPIPLAELPSFQRRPSSTPMDPPTKPASGYGRRKLAASTSASKQTTLSVLSPTTTGRTGHRLQPYAVLQNHLSPLSTNIQTSTQASPFSSNLLTPTPTLTPQSLTSPAPSTQLSTPDTPTTSAPRRTTSTPWSSSAICLFIQSIENSFDFAAFAAAHDKTIWEVTDLWSAIVALPLMAHADKGLARARMQVYREKKKTYDKAVREMAKVHKEEARLEREAEKGAKGK